MDEHQRKLVFILLYHGGFVIIWRMIKRIVIVLVGLVAAGVVFLVVYEERNHQGENTITSEAANNFREQSSIFPKNTRPGRIDGLRDTGATKFEYFPARLEDFADPPRVYGIWPYGIKGNDKYSHNEGHPGWDLELKKGSKLYAIADLNIGQIHAGDKQAEGVLVQVIEAGAILNGKPYHVVYHSVKNIEPYVKEGAIVKAGSALAEVGYPLSETSTMIHFGIFAPNDRVGVCPTGYFSDALQPLIQKIVARSINIHTGQPYESACVGKINKIIYLQNFPDRELGGGEVWE